MKCAEFIDYPTTEPISLQCLLFKALGFYFIQILYLWTIEPILSVFLTFVATTSVKGR